MNFSGEWKGEWAVSTTFRHPLLKSHSSENPIGPLCFTPSSKTPRLLMSSPLLCPKLSPSPQLSLRKFLTTASVLQSNSSTISSLFGSQSPNISSSFHHNRLQLLRFHDDIVVAFFPTGDNLHRIGYVALKLHPDISRLKAIVDKHGGISVVREDDTEPCNQITRIMINQLDYSEDCGVAGYLMVSTMYSVRWFSVCSILNALDSLPFCVNSLGKKCFKSCAVAHFCWSPHIPNESLVLLENGDLFLFDLDSKCFGGLRLKVPWISLVDSHGISFLGCDFSWHPRIVIIYGSNSVFLVDFRLLKCSSMCIAKVDKLRMTDSTENDMFTAFSKVGSDGFSFVMVSKQQLVLYDVRKPLIQILSWVHHLENPCYIRTFNLTDFRAHSKRDDYSKASQSGYCILLGSFWTSEFSVFCYGLTFSEKSYGSQIARCSQPFYAWELPSDFSLSGRGCSCGNCLIREIFCKDALPQWLDWQNKKEIAIGFAILDTDLLPRLYKPADFGGFGLVRLLSSGKLEVQQYIASWKCSNRCENTTKESPLNADFHLLYSLADEKYKFPKKYSYLDFNYLGAYLNGNLCRELASKIECIGDLVSLHTETVHSDVDRLIRGMVNSFGCVLGSPSPLSVIFKDVSAPTSVYEMVLRRLWASLPLPLLRLAFTPYLDMSHRRHSDPNKRFLEFLAVPGPSQLPPFFRRSPSHLSNKWHRKIRCSDVAVGPVCPLPVLLGLRELYEEHDASSLDDRIGELSSGVVSLQECEEVIVMAREMGASNFDTEDPESEIVVSLMNDDDPWSSSEKSNTVLLYNLPPLSEPVGGSSSLDMDDAYSTFVAGLWGKPHSLHTKLDSSEGECSMKCPIDISSIDLKFDVEAGGITQEEMSSMDFLTKQYSKWLEDFNSNS